jgi:hypothetical protein
MSDAVTGAGAREEITDLLYRYCFLLDTGREAEIPEAIFTSDAVENHGTGMAVTRGTAALIDWFTAVCSEFDGTAHYLSNVVVEVTGDTATARSYVQGWHWLKSTGKAGPDRNADFVTIGMYLDELRSTEQGWRISARRRRNVGTSAVGLGATPSVLAGLGGPPDAGLG